MKRRDLSSVFMSNGRDVTPWHSILESRPVGSQGREVQGTVRRPTACLCHLDYCQHDLGCKSRNFQQRCVALPPGSCVQLRLRFQISRRTCLCLAIPLKILAALGGSFGRETRVNCVATAWTLNSETSMRQRLVTATCHLLGIAEQVAHSAAVSFGQLWKK